MTTITQSDIGDITGMDDNMGWTFFVKEIRESDSGTGIVTTKKDRKYPIAGVLTVTLDPGPAAVIAPDGKTYSFTVPDDDSDLWSLIQAAVTIPPGTRHQELLDAVDAWLEVNANAWDSIPGKPAVVAAGADAAAARAVIGASGITVVNAKDYSAVGNDTNDDTAELASAATAAHAGNRLLIPAGTYKVTDVVDLSGQGLNAEGAGAEATIIKQYTSNKGGVVFGGDVSSSAQWGHLRGLAVVYNTTQTRAHTNSVGFLFPDGLQFSEVSELLVRGAHHGFQASGGGNESEFNNLFHTLRAYDCWRAFTFESGGSGSARQNLYASAPSRSSVWQILSCSDFSGEFTRTNLEHSTVRDVVINLTTGHDVSFRGLHMEGLSLNGRGFTTPDGNLSSALIRTTGQGILNIDQWTIDTCHFGAHMIIPSGLTRSGTTAHAQFNLMGFQQKVYGGHGLEVGDSVFLEGADVSTSNGYNGAHTVTAVGSDWVEFTVSGSPATPADVASGSDCIALNLGDQVCTAIDLFLAEGTAGKVHVGNLHMRDIRVIGATASRRQNMLRVLRAAGVDNHADVRIDNISFAGQRGGLWREPQKLVGFSRASNVGTLYFARPHNLHAASVLHVYGAGDSSFNGVYTTLTAVSRYAVQVASTGTNETLFSDNGTAIVRTFQIASVARTGNYATITTTGDHGLYSASDDNGIGLRVAIRASAATAYNTDDALIIDVPSTTTFKIRNVGTNQGTTSDSGSVMLIEGGLSTAALEDGTQPMGGVIRVGDLDEYAAVIEAGAVSANSTGDIRWLDVQRLDPARDVVELVGVSSRDGRLNYYAEPHTTNQVQFEVGNPTAGSITPANCFVRYRVVRS